MTTSPSEKAITEAMVEAALDAYAKSAGIEASLEIHKDWMVPSMRAALTAALSVPAPGAGEAVEIGYTNWRGEYAVRKIVPRSLWHGSTEWHPEPQWLITAHDVEKDAERDFALSGFAALSTVTPVGEGIEPTDAQIKDATTEYLSHRGERPYRVLRGGQELWEAHAPAMRAAFRAAARASLISGSKP